MLCLTATANIQEADCADSQKRDAAWFRNVDRITADIRWYKTSIEMVVVAAHIVQA